MKLWVTILFISGFFLHSGVAVAAGPQLCYQHLLAQLGKKARRSKRKTKARISVFLQDLREKKLLRVIIKKDRDRRELILGGFFSRSYRSLRSELLRKPISTSLGLPKHMIGKIALGQWAEFTPMRGLRHQIRSRIGFSGPNSKFTVPVGILGTSILLLPFKEEIRSLIDFVSQVIVDYFTEDEIWTAINSDPFFFELKTEWEALPNKTDELKREFKDRAVMMGLSRAALIEYLSTKKDELNLTHGQWQELLLNEPVFAPLFGVTHHLVNSNPQKLFPKASPISSDWPKTKEEKTSDIVEALQHYYVSLDGLTHYFKFKKEKKPIPNSLNWIVEASKQDPFYQNLNQLKIDGKISFQEWQNGYFARIREIRDARILQALELKIN